MAARMTRCGAVMFLAATLLGAGKAPAQAIHKCAQADGGIAYQDQPCAPGRELEPPAIQPPPPASATVPLASDTTGATPERRTGPAVTRWRPPPPPLPALYRCARPDGSSYVGSNPNPPPVYVPAWVVGATSTTSNLRRTPAREAFDRAIGGAYVLVQDRCRPMPRAELCG